MAVLTETVSDTPNNSTFNILFILIPPKNQLILHLCTFILVYILRNCNCVSKATVWKNLQKKIKKVWYAEIGCEKMILDVRCDMAFWDALNQTNL